MVVIDDVSLIAQMQAGDESAFELLYSRYIVQAVRVAYLMTGSQQAAEDAAQEAFIQVIRRIHTLREPWNFRPWFYSILHNAARRLGRKGRRWTFFPFDLLGRGEPDSQAGTVDEVVLSREEAEQLRHLVAQLGERHREVVVLRYYADLTEPAIAQVLGVPVGTVKSRLHGARRQLLAGIQAGRREERRDHVVLRG